jgi:hypothetical protein
VSITRPPPHPSHADTCCGAFGQKNPPRPRSRLSDPYQAWHRLHDKDRSWLLWLLRGRVRVFAAPAPLHAKRCSGVRGGVVKNAANGAFFRACEGAATSRATRAKVGATRVRARPRHRAPKNPNSTCPTGHGRRPAINMVSYITVHGRRPAIRAVFSLSVTTNGRRPAINSGYY